MNRLKQLFGVLLAFMLFSNFTEPTVKRKSIKNAIDKPFSKFKSHIDSIYCTAGLDGYGLTRAAFEQAITGYYNMMASYNKKPGLPVLSVVDFTKKSTEKRLWVIDLAHAKLLFNTLVAHGKNTGEQFAERFSNISASNMSSLGFFRTAEIYNGKHGKSLALDGLEKGFNDHARQRSLVIHAADYVSEAFIKKAGRIGRSQGCPAIPVSLAPGIIDAIAYGSCFFIYYPDNNYQKSSNLLNMNTAVVAFQNEQSLLGNH